MTRNPSIDVINMLRGFEGCSSVFIKTVIGYGKQVTALLSLFLVVDKQSVETIFDMG